MSANSNMYESTMSDTVQFKSKSAVTKKSHDLARKQHVLESVTSPIHSEQPNKGNLLSTPCSTVKLYWDACC